jgi:eukaryotic-like serine/threonine-protein kinase
VDPLLERLRAALADRYTILNELGAGGMATVYLAEDLKHRRKVAVKVLKPELAASLGVERFVREIEIAAKLSHPHVLPLFDSGEAGGFLYYVMPYVEGESLRDRLERQGKLPVEEAVRFTDQIASALAYAHERGVIHRDIKPANILLAGDQAIVADFGIARAVEAAGGPGLTVTGLAIGTPAYMSPEQALGTEAVDARTDVYALGCVVYEMVSGGLPFQGSTPQAVLAMQAVDRVPSLRKSDPGIPVFVERAVARALATEPGDRFPSAAEFAQALTTGTVVPRVRSRRTRQRVGRVLAGVAALAVLVLGVWTVTKVMEGPRIQRLAVLPLADLTNDPEQEYLVAGVHEALITELGRLGLAVTARATMVQYRDTDKPIREIARELGVDAVIEGSLYRAGDSLEIAARLYDESEQELWRGTYDGVLSNVLALYRGFARAIAGQIQLSLSPGDEARLAQATPVNPGVYEAYLRGMHLLNNARSQEDFDQAIAYFNQAVEQNPADPLAYTGLAFCYLFLGHDLMDPRPEVWALARAAAERALRLDSTLADAWAALGMYKSYTERDWEGADRAFRRAHELNPSLALNHYHYAWFLVLFGRVDEAVAEHRLGQELDPLTPGHTVWIPSLYWFRGDNERALGEARINSERYPQDFTAHYVLGESAARLGLYAEAIAAHEEMAALYPGIRPVLGHTYARAGRTEDALRILRELEAQPPTSWNARGLACIHAALGNRDEALRWLEFEPAHHWVAWDAAQGLWEAYRDEPRFETVLRRMNLEMKPGSPAPVPLPLVPTGLAGDAGPTG